MKITVDNISVEIFVTADDPEVQNDMGILAVSFAHYLVALRGLRPENIKATVNGIATCLSDLTIEALQTTDRSPAESKEFISIPQPAISRLFN